METLYHLAFQWTLTRRETNRYSRLLMRLAELFSLSLAMLLLPTLIHQAVRCIDSIEDTLGRRARSKFEAQAWGPVFIGAGLLLVWQVWLGRLSFVVDLEGGGPEEDEVTQSNNSAASSSMSRIGARGSARNGAISSSSSSSSSSAAVTFPRRVLLCRALLLPLLIAALATAQLTQLLLRFVDPVPMMWENSPVGVSSTTTFVSEDQLVGDAR